MENQKKGLIFKILAFLNRFAHWVDLVIYFFLCDWLYKIQFSTSAFGFIVYLPLIFQIYMCIKYELKVFNSKLTCETILNNGRVMGFAGLQGQGKSSFACYLASNRIFKDIYTNTPMKIRGKYTNLLENEILALDVQVDDKSLLLIDEATLFFHNRKTDNKQSLNDQLYSFEVLAQCLRHFYNGNLFLIGTDLNRLPNVIRENVGLTNFMLGQGNKKISFLTGSIVCGIAKTMGYKMRNGLRYWDFQQFVKIPDSQYTFDLAQQTKDTDLKHYANLITIYAFDNPNLFDYNDRFLAGVYKELPKHQKQQWENLDFNTDLLRQIGYGEILDYFDKKKGNLTKEERILADFFDYD